MENNIGKKFGMLTILDLKYKNKRKHYLCKCDCGNIKLIRTDSVTTGRQKSCGCLAKKTQFKINDLTGQKFGRLTVIKEIGQKEGRYIWECKCDCGNTHIVEGNLLVSGRTRSCGCLKHETVLDHQKLALKAHIDKNILDNTNISIIKRVKPMRHNTSGVTGVKWDKSRQKWLAEIEFKNKRHYLGRYDEKEDAIKVRKDAEKKLHKKFLEEKGLMK